MDHQRLERQVHAKSGITSRDKPVSFYQLQMSLQLLQFQETIHSGKKKIHTFVYFSQGRDEFTGVLTKIQSQN